MTARSRPGGSAADAGRCTGLPDAGLSRIGAVLATRLAVAA